MKVTLEGSEKDKALFQLIIASIVETKALQQILLANMARGDFEELYKLDQEMVEIRKEQYERLKKTLYSEFGDLPSGLFE